MKCLQTKHKWTETGSVPTWKLGAEQVVRVRLVCLICGTERFTTRVVPV